MSKQNNGGPAFPRPFGTNVGGQLVSDDPRYNTPQRGMTLRDYFMAHAPANPQPWFEPRMPERPAPVPSWQDWPVEVETEAQDRKLLRDWAFDPCYDLPEHLSGFQRAHAEALKARDAWSNERNKQRFIQWPYAWADEQLKAREQ